MPTFDPRAGERLANDISAVRASPTVPWFDASDALDQIRSRAALDGGLEEAARVARSFIEEGYAVLPGLIEAAECDSICADLHRFVARHSELSERYRDAQGRYPRLVNLHLASLQAMRAGNHPRLARILDFLFGKPTGIYSSLYFEFGSQQPMHRDSPFFHTYPKNQFAGCWIALEDIHPDAGPLMYVPGGHRLAIDQRKIFRDVQLENPGRGHDWWLGQALQMYYGTVITWAREQGEPRTLAVSKGDVVIWHPELPQGGSPARDPLRAGRSIVFHCAPVDVQVHQHEAFFTSDAAPPPRYGYGTFEHRKYALTGDPAFQVPG
jgi:hypothetical protein